MLNLILSYTFAKKITMNVAIIGVTGMVGRTMVTVLEEFNFPITNLLPVASSKSIGKLIQYQEKQYAVVSMEDALAAKPDIALFSAGGSVSLEWAPKFKAAGTLVIDNSSAWRMDADTALVVPEINGHLVHKEGAIIANPNCSTIQLVMALAPLHQKYGIERLVISTYQSVSGTGKDAIDQMNGERSGEKVAQVYPYEIDKNCLPHCDVFTDNGYTKEEMKLVNETRKILNAPDIRITATAVRVPVDGGHSESVNVEFKNDFDLGELRKILHETPGVTLQDSPETNTYPMPLYAKGKNDVFVGRLRRDEGNPNSLNMWIVADNLRKGAATNAVQIALKAIETLK
ncbi:MAG: aspartate-semialdehyde dehydrogenase [Sphingobacteriales bacterium]|jgi:aspartate-semialdehyde dehydrogenase